MNCDGVRALLSAYIDGELSGGELLRVEQHLRRCHWCAGEVDALRQTIALVASLDEVEVPATFRPRLHERLVAMAPPVAAPAGPGQRRSRRTAFVRWSIPAAAAAALVIGAAGLSRMMPPAPVVQAPPQEQVAGTAPQHVASGEQPGSTVPGSSDVAGQPGSVSTPEVQTPSGTGEPTDPTKSNHELVTQPGGSTQVAGAVDPSTPATGPDQEPAGEQGAPLGQTSPGRGVTTATVDTAGGDPVDLPSRQHLRASLEVTVADPGRAASDLKSRLTLAKEIREEKKVNVVELQVTVSAADFAQAVQQLEQHFAGQNAKVHLEPVELSGQLDEVLRQIASLQAERADLALRLEGETDPKTLEVGALALANIDKEIAAQEASYQNLLDSLENGEIHIVLKPEPLQ